jgi:hypothetical protein
LRPRSTLSVSISFNICSNIIITSKPRSSELSHSLQTFPTIYMFIFSFSPACLKSSPSYPWFDLVLLLLYVFVFRPLYQICIELWTGFVVSFTWKT